MHTQVKNLWTTHVVCMRMNSHLSGNAGSFRFSMLSPTDTTFSTAFGRKILIEEAAPSPRGSGSPLLS